MKKDWDKGFACLAAYNKSLTASGRWFWSSYLSACFKFNSLKHFIADQAMHWYCFEIFTIVHRKVFIDRSGVEILCSLLKPSTRVFHQDQMFEFWMFDILTFTFRCLSMAQEHPPPFLASSWMNGYLTLHIHNSFVF